MALFERFALDAASRERRFGVKALAERVRWECMISRDGNDWKINNSYVSTIARELVRRHPELLEFIEFRTSPQEGDQ
jgi:hypothetical protein